ncbi:MULTISPECIES: LysR family transcriptional regulator [unclassified Streptomyces]|uniref:LysR substrate-binding domain-containing protein n=1 Tax=unclassified Streptomyces TaxID=2593676 RepID=UPI00081B4B7A|nr:LysR family transcriptional regulator [Streptomyces sp. BvitLS-983]SCD59642.1 DNA-binding transcriptional regulator, LysR family [Streptomyces sp. BvitLS-983]SCE17681.1 DNA-binding transcriptional regulator, LysR family [Streptomyces sp. IgraMP-1]
MEARHLRYAVALAEHAHFGRAATALGIAQPPLSKQIAALEREVGARLFDRTRRGVFPTAAGAAFLVRARAALAEIGAASVDAARAARGESGRLRLGFIASALLDPLPGVLRRFSRERPGVRLELHEMASSRSSAALAGGELDVAVTLGRPRGIGAERLVSVPVGHDHLVAVVGSGHPYAGLRSVAVAQLLHQPLILASGEDEPAVAAGLRDLLGEGSPALASATVARDVHTVIGLAACGVGWASDPPGCWRPRVRAPGSARSPRAPRSRTWCSPSPPRTRSPVLDAFLDVVRANCPVVGAALDRRLGPRSEAAG